MPLNPVLEFLKAGKSPVLCLNTRNNVLLLISKEHPKDDGFGLCQISGLYYNLKNCVLLDFQFYH